MDIIPKDDSMDKQAPLSGLDPADLLRQGVMEDTMLDHESHPFQPPLVDELAPLFPQFEMIELIGKGGMGAVYKVRQKELDRIVALKILPPAIGQSPAFADRFAREAKALAKLNHPGIVTLHEFGQRDGLYYILMEFVDGVNLATLMRSGRISPREALAIVPQICDALQFAHDHGIVHRDIKPENILLDRLGRVKVADFGIAKVVAAVSEDFTRSGKIPVSENQTIAGNVMGTPQYMAPEQIEHPADVDHRADIYALGVVFYQMLTGELPGKDLQAHGRKFSIDVRLDEIVLKAMEKNPELRFQEVSVMKTRVEAFKDEMTNKSEVGAFPVSFLILYDRLKRSSKKTTMVVIVSLFVASFIVWNHFRIPADLQKAQKSAETVDHVSNVARDSSFQDAELTKSAIPQSTKPNRAEVPPAEVVGEPHSKLETSENATREAIDITQALKEDPQLRRLAWQDVYHRENQGFWLPGTAWLPSGKDEKSGDEMPSAPGSNPPERPLAAGEPAHLSMWFSHPLFDAKSAVKISLLDDAGKPFAEPHSGAFSIRHTPSSAGSSKPGWITATIGAGITGRMPPAAKVILRYGVGPWQTKGKDLPANFRGGMALGNGIITSSPGQDYDGKSFVQISRASSEDLGDDQFDFVAITKDGRNIESEGNGRYGSGAVATESFRFDAPLSQIDFFMCRTRPIRESTWTIPLRDGVAKPVSKAEEFIELETQAIQARAAYLGNDPIRQQAERNLAEFIAAHPEFPNNESRKVAEQRRAELAAKMTKLTKQFGPGHAEILKLNRQLDCLYKLTGIGEKELSLKTAEVILAKDLPKESRFQLRKVAPDDPNAEVMEMDVVMADNDARKERLRVDREVIVWDQHIERTSIVSENEEHRLDITFNDVGAARLGEATGGAPGEIRLAVIIDGRIMSAPVVQNQLGNQIQISGMKSREETLDLLKAFPSWEREVKSGEAQRWLMLIDLEKVDESYAVASDFFRKALSKEQWAAVLAEFRTPLGYQGVLPRKILQVDEVQSLPGVPDGEYRVIQFKTQFPKKNDAVETITLTREKDGEWRASGYFIR